MSRQSKKQVLYVDDEPHALRLFAKLFGDRFSIATANSVDEALAYLSDHGPDVGVVITDQRMPAKTGDMLLEQLRHRYPNVVRVLTTAYSDLSAAIKAVNAGGAFRYVTKPWNEEEVQGALARALDYHEALDQRDRLFREKLTVLHRLIVMDRVRGLATAATALEGRIRNAWRALTAYMRQSPAAMRIRVDMEEIAALNMTAIARREAETMVKTVQGLVRDVVDPSTGVESFDVASLIRDYAQRAGDDLRAEDVELELGDLAEARITTDRGLLERLVRLLLRRLLDVEEEPFSAHVSSAVDGDRVAISIRGDFGGLGNGHIASFFSAAIPLNKWPMGLDMDLLSAFMLAHHLGGELTIFPQPPIGPGFRVDLPIQWTKEPAGPVDPRWFDSIYETIEAWEDEIADAT